MLAVIGGSSLSQLAGLDVSHREVLRTPYGDPSGAVTFGLLCGRPVAFLARHGYGHTIPPHEVNYRANIWALAKSGAKAIVSVASVGSIRADLKPGDLVIPHQIIDYLTLMGDASDGIMGVPGVGAKTAAKLLTEYGCIGSILENADKIKGKVGQNIKAHADGIALDHQLASIVCDLDIGLGYDDLKLLDPNTEQLRSLYTELEFRNQLQSLDHPNNPNGSAYKQNSKAIIKNAQAEGSIIPEDHASMTSTDDVLGQASYHTVLSQEAWGELLQRLSTEKRFAFDTETTSLDYRVAQIVGFSVAFDAQDAYYVPLAHDYEGAPQQLNRDLILAQIKPVLEDASVQKIGHHLKYDAHVLENHGIELRGWYFDTMLASYVLNSVATRHGMDDVARLYLSHLTTTFEQLAGKGAKQKTFNQIEIAAAAHYAAEDAHVTYRLYEVLDAKLRKHPELINILHNVEMPVARVLTMMEENGIELNLDFLDQLGAEFAKTMKDLGESLRVLVALERQAFGLDDKEQSKDADEPSQLMDELSKDA